MSSDLQQHSSIAGELAKNLWGRTDYEKYDAAWAQAKNWIVDYRGGLFSRAGFEFGDVLLLRSQAEEDIKFVEFQFSPDTANTYVCVFTDEKVRFIQDNAYVLEAAIAIASLANDSGDRVEFTSASHGLSDGDWVKASGFTDAATTLFNGRTFLVENSATNTFTLRDIILGEVLEVASVPTDTGSIFPIYTIDSPYGEDELEMLQTYQIRDYVVLTHPRHPVYNLIRNDQIDWEITEEDFIVDIPAPSGLSIFNSNDDNRCTVYQVTSVDAEGNESTAAYAVDIDGPDLGASNKENIVLWTAVADARSYNIYRSRVVESATGNRVLTDFQVGFIGSTVGNRFTDEGITPDFAKSPLIAYNPFANGAIRYVSVTAEGTGHEWSDTITWPTGGSGASGYLITTGETSGTGIFGVVITNGGSGYTGTVVSAAPGTGETLVAEVSPLTGNNPHCVTLYQQRTVYGATDNFPLRLFGSRIGLLNNFSYSSIGADDDSYEFDLDAPKIGPLRHLVPVRGGLLVMNQLGIWLVSGTEGRIITGTNNQAEFQNNVGASFVPPVFLDAFVTYISDAGQEIRMLAYDDFSKLYGGKNLSLLSNHLFRADLTINSLTFAPVPSKTLFATQTNGRLIAATVDMENSVTAVTPQWTQGTFRHCIAIEEDRRSRLYVAVKRRINDGFSTFIERMENRDTFEILEESFCVDAGLKLGATYPAAILTPSTFTGAVVFTASAAVFSSGDVGKVLRCGSGKATITAYTSTTEIEGTWTRDLVETENEQEDIPRIFVEGEWTLDSTVTSLSGLWHLEGKSVSILADGVVITDQVVTNGSVTVPASSRVVVGLGYTCIAQTLPHTASDVPIEGRRKTTVGLAFRMYRTAGLKTGASLSKLYAIADREQRLWERSTRLRDEMLYEPQKNDWDRDNQIFFVQDSPAPAAILNFIRDTELGDDKD